MSFPKSDIITSPRVVKTLLSVFAFGALLLCAGGSIDALDAFVRHGSNVNGPLTPPLAFPFLIAPAVGALFALVLDLVWLKNAARLTRLRAATAVGAISLAVPLLVAIGFVAAMSSDPYLIPCASTLLYLTCPIYALTLLTLLITAGTSRLENPAEHVALTLFAAAGCQWMLFSGNLLFAFVTLELASLSLYILAGFDKRDPRSAEAGLKYFLYGGTAAAFLLFGFSLLYGLTGTIEFDAMARALAEQPVTPLLLVALAMVFAGFGYKVAAAPFHLWAPDAYEGAPAPSAALIASASKVAGFGLLANFAARLFNGTASADAPAGAAASIAARADWVLFFAVLITASLLLGNIAALAQKNVRRLLAYSAIAHAGVLLLAVLVSALSNKAGGVADGNADRTLFYYLFTYGLATVGAFGVLAVMERAGAPARNLRDLAGLWRRSPFLGGTLLVFILSLAGIPPLAGFMAKFLVFAGALRTAAATTANPLAAATGGTIISGVLYAATLLAIAASVVALYYYLQILKQAFIEDAPAAGAGDNAAAGDAANTAGAIKTPLSAGIALVLAAALLVVLGIWATF
jgi:NADH-quinone oxidoreductase subunit N